MKVVEYAKRSLSQHFLIDPNIRRKLVAELDAHPEDVVLEVGPGHGELSVLLAGRVARLVLVEKDDRLAAELAPTLGERPDVRLVHADAMECDLSGLADPEKPLRVISNIPYAITSPLLFRLLAVRPVPRRVVVLVQREVAERITAPPGSRAYGALTVGVRSRATAHIAFRVGRRAFRPVPGVDSAAVVIEPAAGSVSDGELAALRTLTRAAFSMRRKQLQKILRVAPEYSLDAPGVERVLADVGVDGKARPERLTPAEFVQLAGRLEEERRSRSR